MGRDEEGSELVALPAPDGSLASALADAGRAVLEREVLPRFVPRQRWFGGKDARIDAISLVPLGELDPGRALMAADVTLGPDMQRYFLPVSAQWHDNAADPVHALARIEGPRPAALLDGAYDPGLLTELLDAMRQQRTIEGPAGAVKCYGTPTLAGMRDIGAPRPLGVEQSNASIAFGDTVILKVYRRLRPGEQPDVEVARFLTGTAEYHHTPAFYGAVELTNGDTTTLAAAFAFVRNGGDAWNAVLGRLRSHLDDPPPLSEGYPFPLGIGELLGQRTAELHKALAVATDDPAFAVEPMRRAHLEQWSAEVAAEAEGVLAALSQRRDALPEGTADEVGVLLERREELNARIARVAGMAPSGGLSRIHGDYHLGQVLVTEDDVAIIDFEGEPGRSLAERREKSSPWRDVAGMLRSFDYAASMALDRSALPSDAEARARQWRDRNVTAFVTAYRQHVQGAASIPDDASLADALLDLFLLQKGIYEIRYELGNRPAWLRIPVRGVLDLLEREPK